MGEPAEAQSTIDWIDGVDYCLRGSPPHHGFGTLRIQSAEQGLLGIVETNWQERIARGGNLVDEVLYNLATAAGCPSQILAQTDFNRTWIDDYFTKSRICPGKPFLLVESKSGRLYASRGALAASVTKVSFGIDYVHSETLLRMSRIVLATEHRDFRTALEYITGTQIILPLVEALAKKQEIPILQEILRKQLEPAVV